MYMTPDFLNIILIHQMLFQNMLNFRKVSETQSYRIITSPRHEKLVSVISFLSKG